MMPILSKVFALAVCRIFDLYETIRDTYIVTILRRHLVIHGDVSFTPRTAANSPKIAIFATYPSRYSVPFICNALDGLRQSGFYIVLIANSRLSGSMREALCARTDRLIERAAVGRDFGAYQVGLGCLGLGTTGLPPECERLVLINDSMFYRIDSGELFSALVDRTEPWIAMFENFEQHYHAQSFFLMFRPEIFRSAAFERFWRGYRPFSSRRHAINKGEVGLSTALRKAGFSASAYFNSTRVAATLSTILDMSRSLRAVIALLPAGAVPGRTAATSALFEASDLLTPPMVRGQSNERPAVEGRSAIQALDLQMAYWNGMLWEIVHRAEVSNPTHYIGLLLNCVDNAPLKRDVCYRGIFDIAHIARKASGFSPRQMIALEADLRDKGLPASYTGFGRLLRARGRL